MTIAEVTGPEVIAWLVLLLIALAVAYIVARGIVKLEGDESSGAIK